MWYEGIPFEKSVVFTIMAMSQYLFTSLNSILGIGMSVVQQFFTINDRIGSILKLENHTEIPEDVAEVQVTLDRASFKWLKEDDTPIVIKDLTMNL